MVKRNEMGMTPAALAAFIDGDIGNALAAMSPGGIEAQEAAGQQKLTGLSDRLPIRGTIDRPELRAQWEAAGFVFGEKIQEGRNTIFVACAFPAGWKLKPTNHSMWSDLLDDKGYKRAAVFFKAAFYDYAAHTFGLECRYRAGTDKNCLRFGAIDSATGQVIQLFAEYATMDAYFQDRPAASGPEDWLTANFPDWRNPLAYWE